MGGAPYIGPRLGGGPIAHSIIVPSPRERGPMGGAPYIGPRLGGGPIFEVSISHLYAKEHPGKLPTLAS